MPELPEVETVVRTLKKKLIGKQFKDIKIRYEKIIKEIPVQEFKDRIIGQKINDIRRIGKHILFMLDKDVLISHLRMEGKYYIFNSENEIEVGMKHVMVQFGMIDGTQILYHDTRRFGTMHLSKIEEYLDIEPLAKVGPEPWDKECTVDYLYSKLHKKSIAIKAAMLDQTIMAGLGNIYVDEVMFATQIHPTTPANQITKKQVQQILDASKAVMEKAIELGGTSINSYTSSLGVSGKFQNELNVHTMAGKECPKCKTIIKKTRVGGRGTYICEKCQKKK